MYGVFLDEQGHAIDDAIVFLVEASSYMVVVNAGMGPVIAGHLVAHREDASVDIADLTDRLGKIDIQGPRAARILARVLENPREVLQDMVYFSFKGSCDAPTGPAGRVRLADGTPLLLSRTGYTGEFGFELFLDPGRTKAVWDALLEAGRPSGMLACGLAARDSLRTGAVLPLAHQDIGPWPFRDNPWPFALPYNEDGTGFTKSFVGDQALNDAGASQSTQPFVGLDPRKVATSDPAVVKDADGRTIGVVTTCATDMGIDRHDGPIISVSSPDPPGFEPKGLSCGFVRSPQTDRWPARGHCRQPTHNHRHYRGRCAPPPHRPQTHGRYGLIADKAPRTHIKSQPHGGKK